VNKFLRKALRTPLFFLPSYIFSMAIFESGAYFGRFFSKPLRINRGAQNYINLGCGPVLLTGFINIDFFGSKGVDYEADLRFPLKIASGSIDGIICEHTMEHLSYGDVENLLSECHRILKPGGVIRIILPDVSLFIKHYGDVTGEWFDAWERLMFSESADSNRSKRRLTTRMQAISFVTQEYGHISAWDAPTLQVFLEGASFKDIESLQFRRGRCSRLLVDLDAPDRKFVSLYMEATK